MIKRMVIVIIALIVLFGGIFGWKWYTAQQAIAAAKAAPPPVAYISAGTAETRTWYPTLTAIGSLRAIQGVDVSTEVAGVVTAIDFTSGDHVKHGDTLVKLDTTADEAQLRSLQAQADLAKIQFGRQTQLYKTHATAKSNVDQARAEYTQAQAQVAQQQAQIDKKILEAPFSGILGIRQVDLGQYLAPGATVVTLQQLNPIYVNFSLPQQDLPKVHHGQAVEITVEGFGNTTFKGKITAINPKVDPNTRNFALQATIRNNEGTLRPGMFVNAAVVLPTEQHVVTVPETAISYNPYGNFVYILDKTSKQRDGQPMYKANRQLVSTGETRGDFVQISKGIKAGDLVVTAGQIKLRPGALAVVNKKGVTATYSANPKVDEE